MTEEQERLMELRIQQCLEAVDEFFKSLQKDGVAIPQALRDAVETLRELQ